MSNMTSTSGEASPSSCNIGKDGGEGSAILQQQQGSTFPEATTLGIRGQATAKRKRNLPGTPDPDAEVVALPPKGLLATNRFICEICHKGFPRDQNLQLHRRSHNLPWELRQRTSKEKRRVYICPEPSCVHHDPSRALGDLTGIKKHFSRKHGEKKWKCDKCSKTYAVQSDWKAHSKTCGTREYRCDCGTLFSRRDSFITHRAFCDALAEETARVSASQLQDHQVLAAGGVSLSVMETLSSPISMHGMPGVAPRIAGQSHLSSTPSEVLVGSRPSLSLWLRGEPSNSEQQQPVIGGSQQLQAGGSIYVHGLHSKQPFFVPCSNMLQETDMPIPEDGQKPFPRLIAGFSWNHSDSYDGFLSRQVERCGMTVPGNAINWSFNCTSGSSVLSRSAGIPKNAASSIVNLCDRAESRSAQMPATALLQKEAQMGATTSYPFLVGSNTSFSAILERDHTKSAVGQPFSVTKDSEFPLPTQAGLVSSFSSIGNTSLNKLMHSSSASSSVFGGSTNSFLSPSRCFARDMEATTHSLENAGSPKKVRSLEKLRFQQAASHERQSIAGSSMPCILEMAEDGRSDSLTHDFLGIGGIRKVFNQKNHVVPSLGRIGVDNINNFCKNRDTLGCLAVHTGLLESRRILNDKND